MIESASDYLYSYRSDCEKILVYEGKKEYVSDDFRLNIETLFNIMLVQAKIENDALQMLNKIMELLLKLPRNKDKKPIWIKASEIIKVFSKKYSLSEYFEMSRKINSSTSYNLFALPIYMVLDYEYFSDGIIWGEANGKCITQNTYFEFNGINLATPLYIGCSMDGFTNYTEETKTFVSMLKNYLETSNTNLTAFVSSPDELTEVACALANFFYEMSGLNKFSFNNIEPLRSDALINYAALTRLMRTEGRGNDAKMVYTNLYISIPKDILRRRKYVLKNTYIKNLTFPIGYADREDLKTNKTEKIEIGVTDLHICEKEITLSEVNYFMIYATYSIADTKRTIPLLVDNIMATAHSFNILDSSVVMLVLGIYGLLEEIEECTVNDEKKTHNSFFNTIKEIIRDIEYINVERSHAKGYHQTKEVVVDAFVRRLPKGQVASEQAKELARKYHVSLGSDCTMVSSYVRNKNKTDITKNDLST